MFTTIGIDYEYMAQKVAEPAAWLGGGDNRAGYLCSAVIYRDSKFSLRTFFFALQGF
ncbi:hypothetical protein D3C87_1840400 [compost metagenome]